MEAQNPEAYIAQLPEDRQEPFSKLRKTLRKNLPLGFEEQMSYGMVGYVVPHHLYPKGYHCNPDLPLPFINIASQKNHLALYHSGIYATAELHDWFEVSYRQKTGRKPDMGKSCVRFKKPGDIPFDLIAELARKMSPAQWIEIYENNIKR